MEGIDAIECCGGEREEVCEWWKPLLKYTFKIKAYSAHLMQHILAVLVEGALRGPPHEQQVESQPPVVVVFAREAHQLAYALLVLKE